MPKVTLPPRRGPSAKPVTPRSITARARAPFSGFVKKLDIALPEDSVLRTDYYLRWFNDTPGRIAAAQRAGYDFVNQSEVQIDDGVVRQSADIGEKVAALVGAKENGQPLMAFLMKLPIQFRREDEARHEAQLAEMDAVIKRGLVGRAGEVKDSHGSDTHYIPRGSPISVKTNLQRKEN